MEATETQLHPVFVPLLSMSALSVGLYLFRLITTGSERLWFMNWNLVLAWLPLIFAWFLVTGLKHRRWFSRSSIALSTVWLLFLPNSFYMVSDFVHLTTAQDGTFVYEIIMLVSYALTGLLLGWLSTMLVHKELENRLGQRRAWYGVLLVFLASAFAIYLGRYLGWNSWDIIFNPVFIVFDISERVLNPALYPSMFTTTTLFFAFIVVSYASFRGLLAATKRLP